MLRRKLMNDQSPIPLNYCTNDRSGLVRIYTFSHEAEGLILQSLLEEEGIESLVQGRDLVIAQGGLPITNETMPTIWVRRLDEAKALSIVQNFLTRPRNVQRQKWICPGCGEKIEEQFSHCWNCGTACEQIDPQPVISLPDQALDYRQEDDPNEPQDEVGFDKT
jgi:hypothetical protein